MLFVLSCVSLNAVGEEIRVGTYNIENFNEHFSATTIRKERKDFVADPLNKELLAEIKKQNDEDSWEAATVILDPKVNPDILGIQECVDEAKLKHFAKRWLKVDKQEVYETVIVFKSNSERNQYVGLLMKPGFKVIDKKEYADDKDPAGKNERGDKLFARGPGFVLVESPSGYRFWFGVTHQKSKSGNSAEATQWRNREAKRTHEIMKELAAQGPSDVVLVGDFNDELGPDKEFEKDPANGGDAVANIVGPPEDGYILATKPLIDAGKISFGGYFSSYHRSFIDGIVVSPTMKDQIQKVDVYTEGVAPVASDHYPVIMTFKADPVAATQPTAAK